MLWKYSRCETLPRLLDLSLRILCNACELQDLDIALENINIRV